MPAYDYLRKNAPSPLRSGPDVHPVRGGQVCGAGQLWGERSEEQVEALIGRLWGSSSQPRDLGLSFIIK